MQFNPRLLKFISFIIVIGFSLNPIQAQDNLLASRIKVDGVSAVVGDYVILDSDIDKTLIEMRSQGIPTQGVTRCQLLGKLMEDKLYAHHAIQDSLEVVQKKFTSTVDQSIAILPNNWEAIEKVLEFYKKTRRISL